MSKPVNTIRVYVNDYDVDMVEIQSGTRPQFVSLAKVKGILGTNKDANLIKPIKHKGRDLFEITKEDGKAFKMGENKMNAVLDNAVELQDAVDKAGI